MIESDVTTDNDHADEVLTELDQKGYRLHGTRMIYRSTVEKRTRVCHFIASIKEEEE